MSLVAIAETQAGCSQATQMLRDGRTVAASPRPDIADEYDAEMKADLPNTVWTTGSKARTSTPTASRRCRPGPPSATARCSPNRHSRSSSRIAAGANTSHPRPDNGIRASDFGTATG